MVKVAIMGYGNIGSGVAWVLKNNKACVCQRAGQDIDIKYILDLRDFPDDPFADRMIKDYKQIVEDPEVQIVIETMGGTRPAYTFVKECLEAGKSVVTSNKELVAQFGAEFLALAAKKNINFLFEASVGGGIPIIRPLNQCITSDQITEITGILNGTTNFMLTKMARTDMEFDAVLKEAQRLGYAERDPSADIKGFDTCRKIAILASLAFGKQVCYEDINTEGICEVSHTDMEYAKAMNKSIKLLGMCRQKAGKTEAIVCPVMIGEEHPLYSVNDVMNGILVRGPVMGDLMFYGAGAGKLPTASAVVADVVDAVRNLGRNIMVKWDVDKIQLESCEESAYAYFVRIAGTNTSVVNHIEVKEIVTLPEKEEFAIVTEVMTKAQLQEKLANLDGVCSIIRMAD